jgi:hypothetical protein
MCLAWLCLDQDKSLVFKVWYVKFGSLVLEEAFTDAYVNNYRIGSILSTLWNKWSIVSSTSFWLYIKRFKKSFFLFFLEIIFEEMSLFLLSTHKQSKFNQLHTIDTSCPWRDSNPGLRFPRRMRCPPGPFKKSLYDKVWFLCGSLRLVWHLNCKIF